jgi:hypothetical protein
LREFSHGEIITLSIKKSILPPQKDKENRQAILNQKSKPRGIPDYDVGAG